MANMNRVPESYIQSIPLPETKFLDSEKMKLEFDRISKIKQQIKNQSENEDEEMKEDLSSKPLEIRKPPFQL